MQFYKEKLLSPGQLKRLNEHKYSCTSVSLMDPFLQPWWNWLVSKVPLWLAPNAITVLGLTVNILTTLILVWYSPDAKIEAPRWACLLCALGLFVYQSLDAIDGKQARRTGTQSPLGELFDHGCDSISTVFVALSACIAVQLGYYPTWMFFQCFCAITLFYCAHWQTYVSGTLRFGKVDVTEAQFTIIGIHIISGIFGPSIWMTEIPYIDGFELKYLIGVMTVVCTLANLYSMFSVIFTGGVGKNGSTVAGTSVLSPIIPFSFVVVPAFIIYRKSAENVYENHPALYILAFGMVAAKVTNRLVVAHMTKNEMQYLDTALIGPAMLFLNQYFNFFIKEYYVLWLCLIWVTLDLLRYCSQVCLEICDHLKIRLFRIPTGGHRIGTSQTSTITEKNEW
ncbi:choline/ethanolaminephosphotransferase 1 isoform X5 [Neodiprion pinetum]|uniref:Choline/ethanolaminephosphotransferase 1 isoform X6 n=1 Tax=Neodiprion lecontei TaxID=441921 RepID=A0ABM3GDV5_NEOLC|nr:choline/ethanolaminephosphotransferase 1 isoform X5 [Neodiprion fabricii]XP_046486180.1 choline/ethanolaminephosphotransferase 1 isoform X6 [Neodiprion pinetum]XP_046598458.1 choline/ethanolaminephosphotransferase 1 isoform X6 [Neodiprion lecontei]XP_046623482.1 choline/ethanolaminephosphotransferase 1 isoform X5 [Neodiprion virginianus]